MVHLKLGDSKIGYVDQDTEIDPDKSVWDVISGGNEVLEIGGQTINSRAYVSKFNFNEQTSRKGWTLVEKK